MTPTHDAQPDRQPWRWWQHVLLHAAIWGGIGGIMTLQATLLGFVPGSVAWQIALLDWGPWIIVGPSIFWLGQRLHVSGRTWKWAVPAHVVISLALAAGLEYASWTAFDAMNLRRQPLDRAPPPEGQGMNPPNQPRPPEDRFGEPAPMGRRQPDFSQPGSANGPQAPGTRFGPPMPPGERPTAPWIFRLGRGRFALPIYWVLIATAHAYTYHRRALERERRALQAEALLAEARLATLQAQLNPHFLFNTLNAIVHYVRANPDAAEEMLTALSDMLRAVLAATERRTVSLREELGFVDHYLAIQHVRFADRLAVTREIEPDALRATVPTLLLQPLVENAVIHGVTPDRDPGTVFIRARVSDTRLHLEVADTGRSVPGSDLPAGSPLAFREGMGLGNTKARLRALYGSDFHLDVTRAAEGGVSVSMSVPMQPPASA